MQAPVVRLSVKFRAAASGGVAGIQALIAAEGKVEDTEANAGAIGEAFEVAINREDIELCRFLFDRYKHEDIYKRHLLEEFLNRVRENMWEGSAGARNEMFEFLITLPTQVNASSVGCAKMMHNGKTYLRKLESMVKAAAKRPKVQEEEEEKSETPANSSSEPKLESSPFIAGVYIDILKSSNLLIWSDGEVTDKSDAEAARKHQQGGALSEALIKVSEACKKLDAEFDKDEWNVITSSETWRGFFVKCASEDHTNLPAGEAFARHVLKVEDRGNDMDVRFTKMNDSRATFWPQRYYYSGHVSKSKLAMVKRATNLVKAPAKKDSIWEVKFHTEERAWFWPPVALVGWSKVAPGYLVGLLYITHDQEHLHHGE